MICDEEMQGLFGRTSFLLTSFFLDINLVLLLRFLSAYYLCIMNFKGLCLWRSVSPVRVFLLLCFVRNIKLVDSCKHRALLVWRRGDWL